MNKVDWNKFGRFLLLFIGFLTMVVFSVVDVLFENSETLVQVEMDDTKYLSVKDMTIEQELKLQGHTSKLKIYFVAPNTTLYDNAKVEISVKQNETVNVITYAATDISDGLNSISDKCLDGIGEGTATLTIKGSGFPMETDLFVIISSTKISGLTNAVFNGNQVDGPVVVQYKTLKYDGFFYYDMILSVTLIMLVIFFSVCMIYKTTLFQKGERVFWYSFLLLFVYNSLKNPLASFLFADPSSEMVYEFWYKAHTMGFWENLMSLMSGECLTWTERILMYIADKVSPTKYVFCIAQLLQMILICMVTSMFSLSYFRKFFNDIFRISISFMCGALLLFPSAYYFWAVSYWVSFFLIAVAFLDFEKMRKSVYWGLMIITVIFTVSRIYHVVYIPIALFLLLYLGKEKGRRFRQYCSIVAISAIFETLYSMINGGQGHLNGKINLLLYIKNTIYYQVQILISYFLGDSVKNEYAANILFTLIFLSIISFFIIMLLKKEKMYAGIVGTLGILSIGTIGINVVVCDMSDSVGFPHNYADSVKFTQCYFQQADLHFAYSYIALTAIGITMLYYFANRYNNDTDKNKLLKVCDVVGIICINIFMLIHSFSVYNIRIVPTDWKNVYQVTKNDAYYLSVNVDYPFAHISLEKNTEGYIYGYDGSGQLFLWTPEKEQYVMTNYVNVVELGNVSDIENKTILYITVRRASTNFAEPYYINLMDADGKRIVRVKQSNDARRYWTDFIIPDIQGVKTISFEYEDGTVAYVRDAIQVGVRVEE